MRRRVIRLGGADASIYHTFCGMFCVLAQPSAFVIFRAFVTLSANQTYGNFCWNKCHWERPLHSHFQNSSVDSLLNQNLAEDSGVVIN